MAEVRICDFCGHHNPMSAMACEECGADLAFVQPTTEATDAPIQNCNWIFVSGATGKEFSVSGAIDVGRISSDMASLLNESDYTSRHHAVLETTDSQLFITDVSTNGTSINGRRITKNEKTELHDGDEVQFANVLFRVKKC